MTQTSILQAPAEKDESRHNTPRASENVSMVVSPVTGESSPASKVPSAEAITEQLLRHCPDADTAMVKKAYEYASAAHARQQRHVRQTPWLQG